MVKCLTHGLRGFNGTVQRRLATLMVTMLISLCWQLSSEVELRRIFDVCKRWANSGSHEFVKKNMVRYMRLHGRFAHCSCKNAALTLDLDPAFLHLQCANRPFWPLVSKYTIFAFGDFFLEMQCFRFKVVVSRPSLLKLGPTRASTTRRSSGNSPNHARNLCLSFSLICWEKWMWSTTYSLIVFKNATKLV